MYLIIKSRHKSSLKLLFLVPDTPEDVTSSDSPCRGQRPCPSTGSRTSGVPTWSRSSRRYDTSSSSTHMSLWYVQHIVLKYPYVAMVCTTYCPQVPICRYGTYNMLSSSTHMSPWYVQHIVLKYPYVAMVRTTYCPQVPICRYGMYNTPRPQVPICRYSMYNILSSSIHMSLWYVQHIVLKYPYVAMVRTTYCPQVPICRRGTWLSSSTHMSLWYVVVLKYPYVAMVRGCPQVPICRYGTWFRLMLMECEM